MKITKLHLILLLFVVAGFFAWKEYSGYTEIKRAREELERVRREDKLREEIDSRKKEIEAENLAAKAMLAGEAVAVAGEYLKIAKRENRNAEQGRATLRAAKESLEKGDAGKAWELAHQSIKEIKASAFSDKTYTVKSGDTLWDIAAMRRHFSDGQKWRHIYLANKNKIKNPRVIVRGQKLAVPVSTWQDYDEAARRVN